MSVDPEEASLQLSGIIARKEQDISRLQLIRQHLCETMDKTNTAGPNK